MRPIDRLRIIQERTFVEDNKEYLALLKTAKMRVERVQANIAAMERTARGGNAIARTLGAGDMLVAACDVLQEQVADAYAKFVKSINSRQF